MIVEDNLDLSKYNSYGLQARCRRAFFPDSEEEIREVFLRDPGTRKILLGSGHNVILAREWYPEDFVILNGNFSQIRVDGSIMEVQAGAFSRLMSEVALQHGLAGLEVFFDIPSSLGGAVVMNAGAGGEYIEQLLTSVRYLDLRDMEIREIPGSAVGFQYRDSVFQRDPLKVVLSARLQLRQGDPEAIRAKMVALRAARWAKQPRGLPNAGSVFKRPPGRYVGPMIDELGLKGFSVGGVSVSEKHSGFIVRHAEAKGPDVLKLIEIVRQRVVEVFGVELEVEQRIIQ